MTEHGSTHQIEIREGIVVKRFRSWERDEHQREWNALTLLNDRASDLAPVPVKENLAGDPPTIAMSRLPGKPVWPRVLADDQVAAMVDALDELHRAVPDDVLSIMPPRIGHPAELAGRVRISCGRTPGDSQDVLVRRASRAGSTWLESAHAEHLVTSEPESVFGLGDGNLTNFLWDGAQVRLVDFENSGRSDRAFELADIVEHPSAWTGATLDTTMLLDRLELPRPERFRLRAARRLHALFWLLMLLPGRPAHERNPPGTLHRQAERLLTLLG